MKKFVVLVALLMLLSGAMAQDATKAKPAAKAHAMKAGAAGGDVSKTLMDMETKMAEAMKANDWTTVGAMMDEKCVSVDENGVTDKAGFIKMMSSMKLTDAAVSDMKVEMFGPTTATVTGKFTVKGTGADGKEMNATMNYVDTWAKRGGKWMVIASAAANAKS